MKKHDTQSAFFGKKILIGVSGSIAAYKIPELVRLFVKNGAEVKVILTKDAVSFVTPLTLKFPRPSVSVPKPTAPSFMLKDPTPTRKVAILYHL